MLVIQPTVLMQDRFICTEVTSRAVEMTKYDLHKAQQMSE